MNQVLASAIVFGIASGVMATSYIDKYGLAPFLSCLLYGLYIAYIWHQLKAQYQKLAQRQQAAQQRGEGS